MDKLITYSYKKPTENWITHSYFHKEDNRVMNRRDEEPNFETMKHPGFARRFREACIDANAPLKQEELGKFLGVSGAMAWNYLNGEKLPSMDTAVRISKKLGVCVEWLLSGRGPKHPGEASGLSKDAEEIARAWEELPPREKAMIRAAIYAPAQHKEVTDKGKKVPEDPAPPASKAG